MDCKVAQQWTHWSIAPSKTLEFPTDSFNIIQQNFWSHSSSTIMSERRRILVWIYILHSLSCSQIVWRWIWKCVNGTASAIATVIPLFTTVFLHLLQFWVILSTSLVVWPFYLTWDWYQRVKKIYIVKNKQTHALFIAGYLFTFDGVFLDIFNNSFQFEWDNL